MRRIFIYLFLSFFLFSVIQCTSARWTVADLYSIDEREQPEKINTRYTVFASDSTTLDNPFLELNLFRIEEKEYTQRVLVERTIQQYRPKWGFALLGSLGAAIAFYAGNTDGFVENRSKTQAVALNSVGLLLTGIAFTNMKSVDEPIRTGETKYLRKSGTIVIPDTIKANSSEEIEVNVRIEYNHESIFNERYQSVPEEGLSINLANLLSDHTITGDDPGDLQVTLTRNLEEDEFSVPVSSFMSPVFVITNPIAELRNDPVYDNEAPFTEVGNGSELVLIDNKSSDRWVEVQLGGSNLFVANENGEIRWEAAEIIADPTVVAVEEVPFGDIGVEYSVPVLKPANQSDLAFVISNHRANQIGMRRYLVRDYRLMELYFRNAFGIDRSRIRTLDLYENPSADSIVEDVHIDTSATLFAYIGGFAQVNVEEGEESIQMVHLSEHGEETNVDLKELILNLVSKTPGKIVMFIDLDFQHYGTSGLETVDNGTSMYRQIADSVTEIHENAALIFSARPDQNSGVFESVRFEQNYHHIFPYFIAQALQERLTILSDLVRHVENQVDYTSRRLHDRPQTVQAFGNLSINLAE